MFKCQEDQVAVLGVCVQAPAMVGRSVELNYHAVHAGRRAIDMLRMVSFDMLLLGLQLPDMSPWDFLRHLKAAFPHQKWALVGGAITEQQEVSARMFGCTTIFESTPTSSEMLTLTARMREQAVAKALAGKFDRPTAGQKSQIRSATQK
jgi:CheY-like chemotaxis protein